MKKITMLYLPLLVMALCLLGVATIETANSAAKRGAPTDQVKALVADGSDPMPICRHPDAHMNCPHVVESAAQANR